MMGYNSQMPPIDAQRLPRVIPAFPLSGVLLLPRCNLPLNIFEPRYLAMTRAALATPLRLIGVIQPMSEEERGDPPLAKTGCAGRIVSFSETRDERFQITLRGLCRFDVEREEAPRRGYRRLAVDWSGRLRDLGEEKEPPDFARESILAAARDYFDRRGLDADVDEIAKLDDSEIVNLLSIVCPFSSGEKQMLLEAGDVAARAEVLRAVFEMARHGDNRSRH